MALATPVWPTLEALDAYWTSEGGQAIERQKAMQASRLFQGHVPGRPKVLCIGPASDPMMDMVLSLHPTSVFQAYPPAIGIRGGPVPSLMMDTDLPPFPRAFFDLVVLSHVLEYRSSPLALISLCYEILQPQGCLLTVLPHFLGARDLTPGLGAGYFDLRVRRLFRQSAFTLRGTTLVRQGGWRPTCLLHLAQPQVPPRPTGRVSFLPRFEVFWRTRRAPGIAASRQTGVGPQP